MPQEKRPKGTTLEGMVWNANHALESALDPEASGIPPDFFTKCKGIVLMTVYTAGFIFSGHSGSGVIMRRDDDGKWSAPSALGLVGYGGGVIAGASTQDTLMFIMDDETMEEFTDKVQTRLGLGASISLGKLSREADVGIEAPNKGTVSVKYSNGAFVGVSIEVGTLGRRMQANEAFYGSKNLTHRKVCFEGVVEIPPESGIPDLHKKLGLLEEGKTWTPTEEDMNKSQRLLKEADVAAEKVKDVKPDTEDKGEEEEK